MIRTKTFADEGELARWLNNQHLPLQNVRGPFKNSTGHVSVMYDSEATTTPATVLAGRTFRAKSSVDVALGTSATAMQLGADNGDAIPDESYLGKVRVILNTVVTAASITWYLASDSAGDQPVTPSQKSDIVGQTSGKGGASMSLEGVPHKKGSGLWLIVSLNAGTAKGIAELDGIKIA